jgi:branched-chain amino acid transport system permease protein
MMKSIKSWLASLIVLIGILAIALISNSNYLYNVLCQIVCYFIVCVGLNFITGLTGQPMMGMAGVFALGSYTAGILTTKLGFTAWMAIPFVLFVGLIVGVVLGYPSLRIEGVYLSLTTIAFSEIVRILITNATRITGGGTGIKSIPNYFLFGYELIHNRDKLFLMIVVAVVISIIATRLIRSRWGRCFVAIRDNIEAVPSCGINVTTIKLVAFILATMIGSLAGGLYAHLFNYINPATYNQMLSVNFVSMLVIGGMGSVWGCLLGSAVVVYLPELLRFTGNYYDFAYALIVLAFIVLMPGGLVSLLQKGKVKSADIIKIFVGGIE